MTINSWGYPGTIAPGSLFARYNRSMGAEWAFTEESSFRVAKAAGTRNVTVQPGWVQGAGILVQSDDVVTTQAPEPSGTAQWHCLVLRLWDDDGDGGYQSSLAWVSGSSSQAIPALTQEPESSFDIPIALARTAASEAQVTHLIDLRIVSNSSGGYQIYDDIILPYMRYWYGAVVYNVLSGRLRMIARNSTESINSYKDLVTQQDLTAITNAGNFGSSEGGWATGPTNAGSDSDVYRNSAGMVHLTLFSRTSLTIKSHSTTGNLSDETIFKLDPKWRPRDYVTGTAVLYSINGGTYGASYSIRGTDGAVTLRSVDAPGVEFRRTKGEPTVWLGVTYMGRDL